MHTSLKINQSMKVTIFTQKYIKYNERKKIAAHRNDTRKHVHTMKVNFTNHLVLCVDTFFYLCLEKIKTQKELSNAKHKALDKRMLTCYKHKYNVDNNY